MSVQQGYKLILTSLDQPGVELRITKHNHGDPKYSQNDCRKLAKLFMGKGPWQHRRQDLWTIDHIVLSIRPHYDPE